METKTPSLTTQIDFKMNVNPGLDFDLEGSNTKPKSAIDFDLNSSDFNIPGNN